MKFEYAIGATPLICDLSDLKPKHIVNQSQLNEWEAANIQKAYLWLQKKIKQTDLLTFDFIKLLHQKMFNDTWRWAGSFRAKELNIGTAPFKIYEELKNLLADVSYQVENQIFSTDEIALRFHHRLVEIHPFVNGNGRHARMLIDAFLIQNGRPSFTWGSGNLNAENMIRQQYIYALKAADKKDYTFLTNFVRT